MTSRFLPHILYSTAIVSLSVQIIGERQDAEAQRQRLQAQISLLEAAKQALRKPNVDLSEVERLRKLARNRHDQHERIKAYTWWEALLGRAQHSSFSEEEEQAEIAELLKELGIDFDSKS